MTPLTPAQPSPFKQHWLLGDTLHFRKGTLAFVRRCMDADLEFVHARVAFRHLFILLDPAHFQHVAQENARNYRKSFAYQGLRAFLGNGLLTNEGDDWKRRRRLLQPKFYKQETQSLAQHMQAAIDTWVTQRLSQPSTPLHLPADMMQLTREVLVRSLFGASSADLPGMQDLETILSTLRQYANERMKNPFHPPLCFPHPLNRAFHKHHTALKHIVKSIIHQRQTQSTQSGDLLSMLLSARDADTDQPLTPAELYDEVVTLFVAGQETTASALTFILYSLAQHPEIAQQVRQEAQAAQSDPTARLPYTRQVVLEGLRRYPPAWAISREAIEPDTIGTYQVPKGAVLFLPIYALHHDPRHWEQPYEFRPERFTDELIHRKYYMPFGPGQRMCIGNHFALQEMQMVLATIIRHYHITMQPGTQLDLMTPMTMTLRTPLTLTFERLP